MSLADDVVPDRLEEIKRTYMTPICDAEWLIAEVERLRATNYTAKIADAAEALRGYRDIEVVALRGALQALVDATATVQLSSSERFSGEAIWTTHLQRGFEELAAARAVAVAVLTGQEPGIGETP